MITIRTFSAQCSSRSSHSHLPSPTKLYPQRRCPWRFLETRLTGLRLCLIVLCLNQSAWTQTAVQSPTDATALLKEIAGSFSRGVPVHQVQLTGSAEWRAGGLEDSGSATLTASAVGNAQVQLNLGTSGLRTESQSGTGSGEVCSYATGDAIAHAVDNISCWKPLIWFLPSISMQPQLLPVAAKFSDQGSAAIGLSDETVYRHLQASLTLSDIPSAVANDTAQQSNTDIGIDPKTFLPAVVAYMLPASNSTDRPIAVEVHFSNYKQVQGVQVPFTIQRYVNGSLQLEITVTDVQIS